MAAPARRRLLYALAAGFLPGVGQVRAATSAPGLAERFVPVDERDSMPPPLVLKDLQGRSHDLAAYRGRVVLANFWATWCAPCVAELPTLELLQARFEPDQVSVLAVNYGESVERVGAFAEKMAMDLPVLLDAFHRVRYDWKVRVLPVTFVIDRRGRLRYVVRGELDWASDEAVARIGALAREG